MDLRLRPVPFAHVAALRAQFGRVAAGTLRAVIDPRRIGATRDRTVDPERLDKAAAGAHDALIKCEARHVLSHSVCSRSPSRGPLQPSRTLGVGVRGPAPFEYLGVWNA